MRHLRGALSERGVLDARQLLSTKQGSRVEVAGLVICRQQPGTASGVVFITLEDEMGFVNLVLWNRVYERLRLVARHATLLLAKGVIERQPEHPVAYPPSDALGDAARETSRGRHEARRVNDPIPGVGPGVIVHVIVDDLERLDVPGKKLPSLSRDFH
jgi:error-prone DNA polymerase